MDHIIKYLSKDKIIWTPFDCEWSAFYQRLKETGYKVVRSSLQEGQDFFEYKPDEWDIIVSNKANKAHCLLSQMLNILRLIL